MQRAEEPHLSHRNAADTKPKESWRYFSWAVQEPQQATLIPTGGLLRRSELMVKLAPQPPILYPSHTTNTHVRYGLR